MPELPEVETVMRGLAARLQGRVITYAAINRADLRWALPPNLAARLTGARVESFRRRGKYFFARLSGGDSLLVHLGMSGRMTIAPNNVQDHVQAGGPAVPTAHEHMVLVTSDHWRVSFVDPRRFGSLDLVPTAAEDQHKLLASMGPEPLGPSFTPAMLSAALANRRTPIKAALLDQTVVAGLGNIYVAEALFRARISPRRLAGTIPGARAARLVPAIRATLEEAITAGGSSLRDYRQASGELGYFQHAWKVYGREGEPCEACPGAPVCAGIKRVVQSGRSTFFCAKLQR
jgi:formamidopyrimidine-DNA glycosylase